MKRLFKKNLDRTDEGLAFGHEIDAFMTKMARKAMRKNFDLRDASQIAFSSVGFPFAVENAKRRAK